MIELQKVEKRYGDRAVVRDFSLTMAPGEITVLIGPSGCGKTTTLEMINGLVTADAGRITVGGEDLANTDLTALRRKIGYVIQEVGLFPHYSAFDNMALLPRMLRWEEGRISRRVRELAELINLPAEALRQYPQELSGGQQQRVGVARALAADPDYLLMDEPFSAVDPVNRRRLQEEFLAIQERLHKTVVFVTHDIDEALRLSDRIALMNEGSLLQVDTPLDLLKRPAGEFVRRFLGTERRLRALKLLSVEKILKEWQEEVNRARVGVPAAVLGAEMERRHRNFLFAVDDENRYCGYWLAKHLTAGNDPVTPRSQEPLRLDSPLSMALEEILGGELPALPVIDGDGRLVGEISFDLLRKMFNRNSDEGEQA